MQALLAQNGCPGWMDLAGLSSGSSPVTNDPSVLTAAAHDRPVVHYPRPLRVARRIDERPASGGDGDELLSSEEDPLTLETNDTAANRTPEAPPGNGSDAPGVGPPLGLPQGAPVQTDPDELEEDEELLAPADDVPLPGAADGRGSDEGGETRGDRESLPPPSSVPPPTEESRNGRPPSQSAEESFFPTPPLPSPRTAEPAEGGDDADELLIDEELLPRVEPGVPPAAPQRSGGSVAPHSIGPPNGAMVPDPKSTGTPPASGSLTSGPPKQGAAPTDDAQSRCEFVAKSLYPAATECRTCHEKIYDEWSISSHAYAMVSPMFHKFEQRLQELTRGTLGYFCYRCHSPVGVSLGIDRATPLWDVPQVAREGITCVACHRIAENHGKSNGERRIETGDVYAPIYGPFGGDGVAQVIAEKQKYKVKTSPAEKGPGQEMHALGVCMPQLSKSDFCATCHQVAVHPGIKLEVVWEQYRASPACRKGVRCQDCHMGRIPGAPSGFEMGPAAVISKKESPIARRHSNHVFYGPGYSIAHPGVFPFHPKADRWSIEEWLLFDWRGGWGTDEFEKGVDEGRIRVSFPEVWKEADDRFDARELLDDNFKKLALKDLLRKHVMENGSHIDGPFFAARPTVGAPLEFDYIVINKNEGHHLITASLGAQPQLWANVALIGPRGNRVWESGYLDSLGDLADIHSEDVRRKRIAYDAQLFNLQTMFLVTGVKGPDREFPLPVNFDIDQLAFIRPGVQPIPLINHPPFIRMEMRSIAPLGSRKAPYRVPAELMCEPGRYRLAFRMRSRLEPLYFMRFCRATPEMMRRMNEKILDFHEFTYEFDVLPR